MAAKRKARNGKTNGTLESAMASLARTVEETRREMAERSAESQRRMDESQRRTDERIARADEAVLTEHTRALERLPEAIRQQIGSGRPAQP
jgi:hypothetical protein